MKEKSANITERCESMHEFWNKGGFVLCTAGTAEVYINDKVFHLTPGGIFIVTPLIQIYQIKASADFERIAFINDLKIYYPVFKQISNTAIPLRISETPCWQLSEKEYRFVISQYERLVEKEVLMADSRTSEEQQMLSNLIKLICVESMVEVVSNYIRKSDITESYTRNGNVAYSFILALHENYHSQRSVSWYASMAHMSTGHFSAVIRETTGQPPSEWISSVTVTYAKLLLEQTNKSIKEIANDLNFPEQFTFRKYFKLHAGMSPTDYRNQSR